MTRLFVQFSTFMVVVSALLMLLTRFVAAGSGTNSDLLAYTIGWQPMSLMLFDFSNATNRQILSSDEPFGFALSADGRLAYSSRKSGNSEIYILDTRADDSTPINITQSPATDESPSSWSPDGRYLAFVVNRSERPQLYVWDGQSAVNITPNDTADSIASYQTVWSTDGRLAFVMWYGFDVIQNSEIYVWDGQTTANLSQNPTGRDDSPVWNADGQVAFLSERDDAYDIYIWDGVSIKNEMPDRDTYVNIAPELTAYYSFPAWTNQGKLVFEAHSAQDQRAQIYVWDGQTATNLSQNPTLHNGAPLWSNDGRWAFVTYFSPQQLLYVRDANNQPLLTTEGQYTPAWSPGGLLMFCVPDPRWTLAVWDGQQIFNLVRNREIRAEWGNGNSVTCSSG